jgi:hypothetical protein
LEAPPLVGGVIHGAITLMFGNRYASLRIHVPPTNPQLSKIREIKSLTDEMQINMYKGGDTFDKMYGKNDFSYLKDIAKYFN